VCESVRYSLIIPGTGCWPREPARFHLWSYPRV